LSVNSETFEKSPSVIMDPLKWLRSEFVWRMDYFKGLLQFYLARKSRNWWSSDHVYTPMRLNGNVLMCIHGIFLLGRTFENYFRETTQWKSCEEFFKDRYLRTWNYVVWKKSFTHEFIYDEDRMTPWFDLLDTGIRLNSRNLRVPWGGSRIIF